MICPINRNLIVRSYKRQTNFDIYKTIHRVINLCPISQKKIHMAILAEETTYNIKFFSCECSSLIICCFGCYYFFGLYSVFYIIHINYYYCYSHCIIDVYYIYNIIILLFWFSLLPFFMCVSTCVRVYFISS